jgi:ribonuclease PH
MPRTRQTLRPVKIQRRFPTHAPGSVLIACGQTRVLCTAGIGTDVPGFLIDKTSGQATSGWVTAEYAMLPGSTPTRKKRGPDSRATEIKRLIGRSLRAAVDLSKMPGVVITCDCDVLKADGGTRTAAVTGAMVAMADAIREARRRGLIEGDPIRSLVAAVSAGIVDGKPVLDLDYQMDSRAEVDLNVVMDEHGRFIELQGTGERATFTQQQLGAMLKLAAGGIRKLISRQRAALKLSRK